MFVQQLHKKIQRKVKQGFTFIETLVAITVLLLSVALPISLAGDGINAARLAQDQIVAFYLAQEGLEMVRNVRDYNKLEGYPQLDGLSDCIITPPASEGDGCLIDATVIDSGTGHFKITDCGVGSCEPIKYNGIYSHRSESGFDATKFTREIRVWYPNVSDTDEAMVEVEIRWQGTRSSQVHTVRGNLFNW